LFTGLVQAMGRVVELRRQEAGVRLVIDLDVWAHRPGLGDSVAVNGCCLTVAAIEGPTHASFDVVPQTLGATTISSLARGDRVNLESAATLSSLLGGHLVQGHIDAVTTVIAVDLSGGEHRVTVETPGGFEDVVVSRGSIALDGISLTLAEVDRRSFTVALIPVTLAQTTASQWRRGTTLNVEFDPVAKQVAAIVRRTLEGRRRRGEDEDIRGSSGLHAE